MGVTFMGKLPKLTPNMKLERALNECNAQMEQARIKLKSIREQCEYMESYLTGSSVLGILPTEIRQALLPRLAHIRITASGLG